MGIYSRLRPRNVRMAVAIDTQYEAVGIEIDHGITTLDVLILLATGHDRDALHAAEIRDMRRIQQHRLEDTE